MGFLGGYEQDRNKGADESNAAWDEAIAGIQNRRKGAGFNYSKGILRGLKRGDTSLIGNPFLAQQAANNRLAASHADPFLPPELAKAQQRVAEARNAETAGINFENYVHNAANPAANLVNSTNVDMDSLLAQLRAGKAKNFLDEWQGHQTQGWGNALFQGIGAAGGLLTGLGGMGAHF